MLRKLIKESFDLWVRMRWLKTISKETEKRNKAYEKFCRHRQVANKLYEEYLKLYPDTIQKGE